MRRTLSVLAALPVLAGCVCTQNSDPNWERHCNRNYSTNSYELSECMSKVESSSSPAQGSASISLDPNNVNRVLPEEAGKGRD